MDKKDLLGIGEVSKIAKVPIQNIVNPVTATIGNRINDVFRMSLFPIEIGGIAYDAYISNFKDKIASKINQIPKDEQINPKISLIGPAIEQSKYYIESEEMQELFSNLIAASVDVRKSTMVHTSYVEILKQLSPYDAKILQTVWSDTNNLLILGDIIYSELDTGFLGSIARKGYYEKLFSNFSDPLNSQDNYELTAVSLTNLKRLGLIEIITGHYKYPSNELKNKSKLEYNSLINSTFFQALKDKYPTIKIFDEEKRSEHERRLRLIGSIAKLTQFGELFASCCII